MSRKMALAASLLGSMFVFGGGCLQTAHQVAIHGVQIIGLVADLQTLGIGT